MQIKHVQNSLPSHCLFPGRILFPRGLTTRGQWTLPTLLLGKLSHLLSMFAGSRISLREEEENWGFSGCWLSPVLGSVRYGNVIWERYERWRLNRFTLGALKRSSVHAWARRSEAWAPQQTSSTASKCTRALSGATLALSVQFWRWN